MTEMTDLLRGELERLFELDELNIMTSELLGYDPEELGSDQGKGAFARAIVSQCEQHDALEALADAIVLSGKRTKALGALFESRLGRDLKPGRDLEDLRVIKKISSDGSLGAVFLAERKNEGDEKPSRYAVKVIRSSLARDRSAVSRYLTNQRAIARAGIENVAGIARCGVLGDGRPWVATDYIEGQTLAARIDRVGPVHINEAKPILRGVLLALAELHDRGLTHGDVKASNVFIVRQTREDGTRSEPSGVLVDGGAHRLLAGGAPHADAVGTLRVFGKAKAIAPEMALGKPVGASADLYAVGVMIYEIVSGRAPFTADTAFEVIAKHIAEQPEPPSAHGPKGWVPKDLDEVVLKALSKDPKDRFPSARSFLDAIENVGRRAEKLEDLDNKAFGKAKKKLLEKPKNEERADNLEAIAAPAGAWDKAIEVFGEAGEKLDGKEKVALLLRVARIQKAELRDNDGALATYRSLLEHDEENTLARAGVEEILRSKEDPEALAEHLLERAESEPDANARAAIFREIAELYDEKLDSQENAFVLWVQALTDDPSDDRTVREIERIAGNSPEMWNEAMTALSEAVQSEDSDASDKVRLYTLMGGWYGNRLSRPDFAVSCYGQAIALDPTNDAAYEGSAELYRKAQSWNEYVQVLVSRADASGNPAHARDFRAQAADTVLRKMGNADAAMEMFNKVLGDDPGHPLALDGLQTIYTDQKEWAKVGDLLNTRTQKATGDDKVTALLKLAEFQEDRLDDLDKAQVSYESALAHDGMNMGALKGLERLYARRGRFEDLLGVLNKQLDSSATPRQRIALFEHIGAIHEEEFVDHEKAIEAFERIVDIEPGNDNANVALARLYRPVQRFDDLVDTLDRHANAVSDNKRKVDLLLQGAKTLFTDVGAPDRAGGFCERVLAIDADNNEALDLSARIQASSGDAAGAVTAVETMAERESDGTKKAQLWVRAGRLLADSGDKDRAIDRFKRALDADAKSTDATAALRGIYAERGDAHGAAEILRREIEMTDGNSRRAELYAELGNLYRERLEDDGEALSAYNEALSLDGTCTPAARGLGDLAYASSDFAAAVKHYEPLLSRTSDMDQGVARDVCVQCGDAFRKLDQFDKAQRAYLNAKAFAPNDREVLERLAEVTFESGAADEAAELYRDLQEKFDGDLSGAERGRVLFRRGEAARRSGAHKEAIPLLDEAAGLLPEEPGPLDSLRQAYEAQGKWDDALKTIDRRLMNASDEESFDLFVCAGDILMDKKSDRAEAGKRYVQALEITPDDRNLLTKLMGVYSGTKDWSRLVEVILRIAELVDDPRQLTKYYATAGSIAHRELKRHDEAADYYEQALENDGNNAKAFEGLVKCLNDAEDWHKLSLVYRDQLGRLGSAGDAAVRAGLWDALGDINKDKLDDPADAYAAYEEAQKLEPENQKRLKMLADSYAGDPRLYFKEAVEAHHQLLRMSPYRVESYQALRQLYTDMKRADESWCMCQTLRVLNMAGAEEKSFFKKHRSRHPAEAQDFFNEEMWFNNVIHHEQDPLLTGIFATITPAVAASRSQPLSAFSVSDSDRRDAENDDAVMAQTLHYVAGVTKLELPPIYARTADPGGLSVLFTSPPAIGLGKGALAGGPDQALAFVAGRHVSFYRAGHYLRHLVPTGGGLRAWLIAAIKSATPEFPVPAKMQATVGAHLQALQQHISAADRRTLNGLVQKLLAAAPELDMKRWVAAIDYTADRVGFIMSNDLQISATLINASGEDQAVQKNRLKELYLYSVSSAYFELREKLGIAIA